jgi:hypothetical protein
MKTQQIVVDTPAGEGQEESTTSRGKRSKPNVDIDMFLDPKIKMEVDTNEYYNVNPIESTIKHKQELTSKRSAKGKKIGEEIYTCA